MSKMNQVMIDLETLGTRADSVILSIGAVKFNETEIDDNGFYVSLSIDSNHEFGARHISESTLIWWLQQSKEAQRVFFESKLSLGDGLRSLSDFLSDNDYFVWSNGADFDIPMLAHAYATADRETPWKFYNSRCYRTMKNLKAAALAEKPANPIKHNALYDAMYQAQHLQNIWKVINGTAKQTQARISS